MANTTEDLSRRLEVELERLQRLPPPLDARILQKCREVMGYLLVPKVYGEGKQLSSLAVLEVTAVRNSILVWCEERAVDCPGCTIDIVFEEGGNVTFFAKRGCLWSELSISRQQPITRLCRIFRAWYSEWLIETKFMRDTESG